MYKNELIEKIALRTDLKETQAKAAVDAFIETIAVALEEGDKISLKGFGTFEVRERDARVGRNPKTGESMEIPASKAPAFKASTALKNRINQK